MGGVIGASVRLGDARRASGSTRPTRQDPDGRPTVAPCGSRRSSRHITSERILGEEDFIISWAIDAQDAEPEPSRHRRRRRPRRDASRGRTSGRRQRPTRARRRPGRRRQDDHAAHSGRRSARQLPAGVRRRTVGQGRPCPRTGDRGAVRHARQAAPRVGTHRPTPARRVRTSARSDGARRRSRHGRHVRARPTRLARRTPTTGDSSSIGDHHQLQAVGRGGMFHELCRTGRAIELDCIHRFHEPWEAAASLQLRHGDPRGLDAYIDHDRVVAAPFDDHLRRIAKTWLDTTERGLAR